MNIIEQAARRLEELRRAGIDVSDAMALRVGDSGPALAVLEGEAPAVTAPAAPSAPRAALPPLPVQVPAAAQPSLAQAMVPPAVVAPPVGAAVPLAQPVVAAPTLVAAPAVAPPEAAAPGARPAGEARTTGRVERPARPVDLDLDRLERESLLTPRLVNRILAEEMRIIKMEVLRNVKTAREYGLRGNLILVTSAVPGEGKTYTSINLAMSLAMEIDHHAMLVDTDVLRPSVLSRLGLPESPGLLDLATRPELDVSDVLLRVMPKLTLLPAGTRHLMSSELLSSSYMDRLLTELSERYPDRLIIFDAPPILVGSGARQLASRVGQVVMVVRADSTDSRSVSHAFAAVESCSLVHTVLNCSQTVVADYGYYQT